MPEGRVYNCNWSFIERENKYKLWIDSNKLIATKSASFNEAEEDLSYKIMKKYGDGECVLDFNPPRPKVNANGFFEIMWNEHLHIDRLELSSYYNDGFCPVCFGGRGGRNETTIIVSSKINSSITMFGGFSKMSCLLISDSLRKILIQFGIKKECFREIVAKKNKELYFEVSLRQKQECAITKNPAEVIAWQCAACHQKYVACYNDSDFKTSSFQVKEDLSKSNKAFLTGNDYRAIIIVPAEARNLIKENKLKGVAFESSKIFPGPFVTYGELNYKVKK